MRQNIPKSPIELTTKLTLHAPNLSVIPNTDDYPWFIREFQKQLQALEDRNELWLPNLRDENNSIAIFSDYGGESSDSRYYTYSFLICAWDQIGDFTKAMKTLRSETGLNDKEIAFKDFNYGPIKRTLRKYIENLSNLVNGYLLTVVIEKSVDSIFGTHKNVTQTHILRTLKDAGFGDWKPKVAEKLLRITHFSVFLVALLSKEGQKIFWMTDNDAIAPSKERFNDTLKLFSNLLNHYCKHEFSLVCGATTFKEKSPQFLDLLSATDIVAGSIEHYFTRKQTIGDEFTINNDVDHILAWLTGQGIALKRHTLMIKKEDSRLVSGTIKFNLKEPNLNDSRGCK